MLRSRVLAAATAAVLMLGFSVGGAGAAFAETDELVTAVDESVGTETVVEPALDEQTEPTFAPAVVPPGLGDEGGGGGGGGGPAPHPDGGATKVTVCHATPPDTAANGWNSLSIDDDAAATNQSGHDQEHDADIIEAFSYWHKVGTGISATWEYLSYPGKNLATDFDGFSGAEILANDCVKPSTPPPPVIYEVGLYLYKKLNPDAPASWPNSGPQTFIDSQLGVEWFTEFPSVLPENVCGEGWAVQQDKVSHTGGFTWPASITYPDDNIGWPPIYDARHDNLETYLTVPECAVALAVVAVDERDCFEGTSFVIDEESSENVTWGDPVINEDDDTISITATATGNALFDDSLDGVSEDRTTRTFTEPYEEAGGDDCVAPSVDVVAAFSQLNCDTGTGSFTVGLFNPADENADKLLWTTTNGTVPSASANVVSDPGVVTVTVRVADAHLGDFAVNETSSLGSLSIVSVDGIETALITWTFTFTEPDDCELGSVVVPIVTFEDYCEGAGPNALRVATFTVTDVENASYTYTVNGGSPMAIVFNGAETATIAVNPLDVVVVTATPADGFELNDGYEPWEHTFLGAAFCPGTFPATIAAADITPADCEGSDVVVTLSNEPGVVWTLNGQVVDGNAVHELAPGSAVQLTAELEGPEGAYTWSEPDQQTLWTAEGTSDEECLSRLAYTGATVGTEWIGAAAVLMMIVGMGFVVRRRSVEI